MRIEDKTMLALAALSYRGYGNHNEAMVAKYLDPWLPGLADEGLGTWRRVWGPACFRAPTSFVDDAMVYVAKRADASANDPPHYAVAVRGTNPISLFDWVFGDFWVRYRVGWDGDATVPVSASTALGLAIVQNLTATEPASEFGSLAHFANGVTSALQGVGFHVAELLPDALLGRPDLFDDDVVLQRIADFTSAATQHVGSGVFGRLLDHFDGDLDSVRDLVQQRVFTRVLAAVRASRDEGSTLLDFLTSAAVEPGATVSVTGHSKGGALAVATALWLHETWAPQKGGTVECFSFAGPTAGGADFVARFETALGSRTRSVVNRCDVVPHAWAVDDLQHIGDLYPALDVPTELLAQAVDRLEYAHVRGAEVVEFGTRPRPGRPLVEELAYQHLDAYLLEAGFRAPRWNARAIFLQKR